MSNVVKVDPEMLVNRTKGRRKKLTEGQINRLVTSFNEGATITSLADEYHIARGTVRRYLQERS